MDEDIQAAAARLVRRLKEGGHTITVAESCTGGLLASAFTDIAGASNWFNQSWVTYSNDAKMAELKVELDTLEKYGAVSANVAIEMAKGALEQAGADIAISAPACSSAPLAISMATLADTAPYFSKVSNSTFNSAIFASLEYVTHD